MEADVADDPEIDEETRRSREGTEMVTLQEDWKKQVISEHLVYVKGSEIVFFEFIEIILDLANRFRETVDPTTGKFKVILTKFIEDWLLRRLQSFVKFSIPTEKEKADASRQWPESEKDVEIKALLVLKKKNEEERRIREADQAREAMELSLMREQDTPALDMKELEAIHKKKMAAEEAARRAKEAAEEEQSEDDGSDDDQDSEDAS